MKQIRVLFIFLNCLLINKGCTLKFLGLLVNISKLFTNVCIVDTIWIPLEESGKLISIEEVDERDVKIGYAIRAGILKLCNDTAPMVEGLDAAKAHAVLTEQGRAILEMLADGTSEFWRDQEEKRGQ